MRYHYEKPAINLSLYGITYICNHAVYSNCTLFLIDEKGLAVIQQRYDEDSKCTWWSELDPWISDSIYLNDGFQAYFKERAKETTDGLYPTVTVRQVMWALKMKPLKKERWETVFDRRGI